MLTTRRSTAVGVFQERSQAECALRELQREGFLENQMGLIMRHEPSRLEDTTKSEEPHAGQGAAAGLVAGGFLGGVLAVATGLIPGVGPVLAAGLLTTALVGVTAGAAAGGLVGALIGLGIPEEEIPSYQRVFEEGHILVTVQAHEAYDKAVAILERCGAYTEPHLADLLRPQG